MIFWSNKKCLVGPRMARDVVNSKTLELETAKEILGELFDIRTHEVDEMIRQRMEVRILYGRESTFYPLLDSQFPFRGIIIQFCESLNHRFFRYGGGNQSGRFRNPWTPFFQEYHPLKANLIAKCRTKFPLHKLDLAE